MTFLTLLQQRLMPHLFALLLVASGFAPAQTCCCSARAERAQDSEAQASCCSQREAPTAPRSEPGCDDCRCSLEAAPEVPVAPVLDSASGPAAALWLEPALNVPELSPNPPSKRALLARHGTRAPPGPLYLITCSFRC